MLSQQAIGQKFKKIWTDVWNFFVIQIFTLHIQNLVPLCILQQFCERNRPIGRKKQWFIHFLKLLKDGHPPHGIITETTENIHVTRQTISHIFQKSVRAQSNGNFLLNMIHHCRAGTASDMKCKCTTWRHAIGDPSMLPVHNYDAFIIYYWWIYLWPRSSRLVMLYM